MRFRFLPVLQSVEPRICAKAGMPITLHSEAHWVSLVTAIVHIVPFLAGIDIMRSRIGNGIPVPGGFSVIDGSIKQARQEEIKPVSN